MTRAEWAKRPLRERTIAAEAWCNGWDVARRDDMMPHKITDSYVRHLYALDLDNLPAQDERVAIVAATVILLEEVRGFAPLNPKALGDRADEILTAVAAAQEQP